MSLPSNVVPVKNCTLVTAPSSVALVCNTMLVGGARNFWRYLLER